MGETPILPQPAPASLPPPSSNKDTPERKALSAINGGQFARAEKELNALLESAPNNLPARYLLAVALVHQRKYEEARVQYRYIQENSTDPKLSDMAREGLNKLAGLRSN